MKFNGLDAQAIAGVFRTYALTNYTKNAVRRISKKQAIANHSRTEKADNLRCVY
ncbi:MAG: hypothetical protein KME22_06440 [Hassallia sp. WJT32-NPBG1]|jgi:hypothetical protein|nr:hypothetical protein [Hassallia sp. WJT32-NPBG1]